MEKYILNETPVRTSNNFGINNIEVNMDIPQYKEFVRFDMYVPELEKIKWELNSKIESTNKLGIQRKTNYSVKVIVPENTKIEYPIKLKFELDQDNEFLVENIEIILEKNALANFEILYTSDEENDVYYHNGELTVRLQENATSKITLTNILPSYADNLYSIQNELAKNSKLEYIISELGGKNKISNYYSKLIGDNSKNYINMIYLGKEKELIDINYNIETYGKETKTIMNVQGAITDSCKKNFKGTIDFKQGAKKSVGKENENCMILSPNAKSKSLPMLLCHEEDVEGEHGVSSGKLDENKLFYIMTKGISYEDAKKLIIKANFNDIIKNIEDEELKNMIEEQIGKL